MEENLPRLERWQRAVCQGRAELWRMNTLPISLAGRVVHGKLEEADDKYVPMDTLQQRQETSGQAGNAKGKQDLMEKSAAGAVKDNQHSKAKAEGLPGLARKSLLPLWKSHFGVV